ncbi:endonuclease VII [Arthrobacter phage Nitro]|uniref:Endonuclease VII n=1 Tax=Arthrobacter phage Nitro TaxID=3077792 RepID=A0AA96KHT3_9CAUD|nr:endonuclease VII [Arthrobacter phage Nitro]
MKTCSKCRQTKPETDFHLKRATNPEAGYRSACKDCTSAKGRVYTDEEKADRARKAREYRAARPEIRWRAYLKQYGVTPEWYAETLAAQGGGCDICGVPECATGARFSVDHDHSCCNALPLCGQCARGLLCRSCNVGIGNLKDDPAVLRAAAAYLEKFPKERLA